MYMNGQVINIHYITYTTSIYAIDELTLVKFKYKL